MQLLAKASVLLGLISLMSGCVVETPREGYYDRHHHRYYHERSWHECGPHDDYWCRCSYGGPLAGCGSNFRTSRS